VVITPEYLDGFIFPPAAACEGQAVTLTYTRDAGTLYPEKYYWMTGTDTMYHTSVDYTNVYTSGSYWVTGTDHYGCYVNTPTVIVNIQQLPPAIITGDTSECVGTPYTLSGWAGSDPSIIYTWLQNGVVVGTGPTYTDPALVVTSSPIVYQLVIAVPNAFAAGDTCRDTSAAFDVTVHPLPPPPGISVSMLSCSTYTVQLDALGPPWDQYNWSNGGSGQIIDVTPGGGPYRVWCTDTFGCISHSDVTVPKDPALYLWTFPTGCYTFCTQAMPDTIVGPIIPFVFWGYLHYPSGLPGMSGSGYVPYWLIDTPGIYDFVLSNVFCSDTSGLLDVQTQPCNPPLPCQFKQWTVTATAMDTCPVPHRGCCKFTITLNIAGAPMPENITVTITDGTLSPSMVLIPAGSSVTNFEFHPGAGFKCDTWQVFTITYYNSTGQEFTCSEKVYIPCCKRGTGGDGGSGDGRETDGVQDNDANAPAALNLVPNPAQNTTRVDFALGGTETGGEIDVYDVTGRLISSYTAVSNEGSWQLPLDNFAPGIYLVALRENGVVILYNRLSVVR
jgi:hypothetical protein